MKKLLSLLLLLGLFADANAQTKFKTGVWRGTFTVFGGNESPFNFELTPKDVYLLNGSERFELKNYKIKGDSLFIPIEIYDGVLAAKIENGSSISGVLRKFNSTSPDIPFKAQANQKHRFFEKSPEANVSLQGNWDFLIGTSGNKTVGVFNQIGSKLTGTILSTTGDYRFFEGSVKGNEFFLSAFSGSSPSLIKGTVNGDQLRAEIISFRGSQTIQGLRNEKAALPDAYTLTKIKEGSDFDFSFPDAFTGKLVSLKDEKYKGKAVIVTILGSWCPNCLDEALFLSPWYKANKSRGVEIIGLSYERKNDPTFAKTRLEALKKRFDIDYDLLFCGLADKNSVAQSLPALDNFLSFPTTIYIDKNGKVRKIHTGYSGPATGKYYEEFVKEFNEEVNYLLNPDKAAKL
jgi:thiol-disulfide isomerase/thioredoxin